MAITFSCNHCGKSLTTTDDKAGRKAKCPGCGEVVAVPDAEPEPSAAEDGLHDLLQADLDAESSPALPRAPSGTKACPMCGEKNPARAEACEFCGEEFDDVEQPKRRRTGNRHDVEIGEVMSDAWEAFKANFGLCVGAQIITSMVIGMSFLPLIVLAVVFAIMMDQANNPNQEPPIPVLLGMIPALLVGLGVTFYMLPGLNRFYLTVARDDDRLELTTIFKGGRYFLPFLGFSLLYGLCSILGIFACGVGYLAVVVLGWPITYIVCDHERTAGGVISRSLELTKPNWVMSLMLVFVAFGLQFAIGLFGALPCIGPIVSLASILIQPYFQLLWAMAYVKMSGQD